MSPTIWSLLEETVFYGKHFMLLLYIMENITVLWASVPNRHQRLAAHLFSSLFEALGPGKVYICMS